jgi:hypothetical protein
MFGRDLSFGAEDERGDPATGPARPGLLILNPSEHGSRPARCHRRPLRKRLATSAEFSRSASAAWFVSAYLPPRFDPPDLPGLSAPADSAAALTLATGIDSQRESVENWPLAAMPEGHVVECDAAHSITIEIAGQGCSGMLGAGA